MAAAKPTRLRNGIVLLVLGASCNAIGIKLTVEPRPGDDTSSGIFWIVFSVTVLLLPGLVLVLAGFAQSRRAQRLEKIVALATASERVPLVQLATDLETTVPIARDLLLSAINSGSVVGRLDLEEGVFLSGSTRGGGVQKRTMTCAGCGASSTVIVSATLEAACEYCGFRVA
jgi:hypothetical protein